MSSSTRTSAGRVGSLGRILQYSASLVLSHPKRTLSHNMEAVPTAYFSPKCVAIELFRGLMEGCRICSIENGVDHWPIIYAE